MTFQPLLDLARPAVFAHEALVRGATGESVDSQLADFQPDLIKLDMALISDIDQDSVQQILAEASLQMCRKLHIRVIAEGIETTDQLDALRDMGVEPFQGYLFAKSGFETLPETRFPC
jgi:EAL domain-containing protein (putative c-di-GMP-specific phosphodiesterase class I)